jgi:hypothetical protein
MQAISVRRVLGLILLGAGLLLAVIYFSQLNRSTPPTPSTPRYYGPLVPTSIGQTAPAQLPPPVDDPITALLAVADSLLLPSSIAQAAPLDIATLTPKRTSTPLATTRTPISKVTRAPATKRSSTSATVAATVVPNRATQPPLTDVQQRTCVSAPYPNLVTSGLTQLRPGWYLNWTVAVRPARPNGVEFAQMVRVPQGKPKPDLKTIGKIAQQNPGSLWLVGNEMDVIWQDNATPEQYAAAYHDVYATLKQADPNSRVAIGGISLPSPLRLQYLDRVLQVFREQYGQEMPIDVWNVHNFILPEQRGSWGVDIPPGIDATQGLSYAIDDHDRLDIFKQQLVDFRRWMAQHGYRDKELLVTEYGVLMPADYGFDHARVRDFMLGTFEYMRTATDPELGRPADSNRLVQRWCWYSLADTYYPTGNLLDPATRRLTPLGRDFKLYLETQP